MFTRPTSNSLILSTFASPKILGQIFLDEGVTILDIELKGIEALNTTSTQVYQRLAYRGQCSQQQWFMGLL